jgi:hypothetical protein
MEKHAAQRCQAWHCGERIANVPHPPHHWPMDATFSPVAALVFDHSASDELLFLLPRVSPTVSLRVLIRRLSIL